MEDLMKELYKRYGDFSYNFGAPLSIDTALKIYKNGVESVEDLELKIKDYETQRLRGEISQDRNELVRELTALQPNSFSLQLMYIWLLLDSMDNDYFKFIGIKRLDLYRIVHSITYYLLFLQTYLFTDLSISKSALKSIFRRKDFMIGIDELKMVCWTITEQDYQNFCELFALDVNKNDIESLKEVQLFMDDENIFLFWINDFLEYILLDIEKKYRKWSITESYSNEKGTGFEKIVYGFTSQFYNKIVQNVFYHEKNKKSEIDLVIQDRNYLIIVECKSGTIDLKSASSDTEIIQKINFKLKKAYKTLDNVANYIDQNQMFAFEEKSKKIAINGDKNDYDFVYLHLSMYPIDALSSNIHTINDKYYSDTEKPKLSLSFEHFLAICVDCHEKDISLGEYLAKRRDILKRYPKIKFDNNELDLYYQLTNKSMLQDSIDDGLLENISPNAKIITTFKNYDGVETRPASTLLIQLEHRLFNMLLEASKRSLGLNKKFIKYMSRYLRVKRE